MKKILTALILALSLVLMAGCGDLMEPADASSVVYFEGELSAAAGEVSDAQISSVVSDAEEISEDPPAPEETTYETYYFRNQKLLNQHYEKHGIEMGFDSAESYEKAACDVINNPEALTKTEEEDGDYIYYVEATNEFVVLSTDGYIRTYFNPGAGKKYFDRQ